MNIKYEEKYDEKFAIIIGINNYESAGPLEYAENDAKLVKDTLISKYSYKEENIILLLNENATKKNILDKYNAYIDNIGKDDSLLFYYAGHGITKMNIEGNEGFLVPYDGNEQNYNTLISWKEIIRVSNLIISKHIFFVLDACYSGLALTRNSTFGRSRFLNEILTKPARQVLTAGASDQPVKDGGGIIPNHSLFTSYFIKAIEGEAANNNVLTANMVMSYVYNAVSNNTYSRQTPKYGYTFGEGDFVFDFKENEKKQEQGKNENVLVRIPVPFDQNYSIDSNSQKLKELLPDINNRIKIYELVNDELKNTIAVINTLKKSVPTNISEEQFKQYIEQYNKTTQTLLEYTILLLYYGEYDYLNLVKRIIKKLQINKNGISGNSTYLRLLDYPCFLIFFVSLIVCIDSENNDKLKELIKIENENIADIYDSDILLCKLINEFNEISDMFSCVCSNKEYKYPFSEYLYGLLQPVLDDYMFLGDDYEKLYLNVEEIISLIYAFDNYKSTNFADVWGYDGRYLYKTDLRNKDISNKKSFKILDQIGAFDFENSSKSDFITHFNNFVSRKYF